MYISEWIGQAARQYVVRVSYDAANNCVSPREMKLICVLKYHYHHSRCIRTLESQVRDLTTQLNASRAVLPPQESPASPSASAFISTNSNIANADTYVSNGESPEMIPLEDSASPTIEVTHDGGYEQYEEFVSPVQEEDTNADRQTKAIEFHGSTSSIALLRDLQMSLGRLFQGSQPRPGTYFPRPRGDGSSGHQQPLLPSIPAHDESNRRLNLVSELRNTSFSPRAGTEGNATMQQRNLYIKEAQYFIDAYFQNFHFVHPFIDKKIFHQRVANLWALGDPACDMCFFCTYLSLMSLGALIGEWEWEEDRLGGLSRFEWSRKLFDEALANLADLHFPANLDTVHCLFLCAKVCQNELNHNMAYLYSGFAVRICLTAGFNQNGGGGFSNSSSSNGPSSSLQISRTWWGLYFLEMELSFALGRPDTLGLDEYHDQPLPPVDDTEFAFIPLMVDFARIVRRIAIGIYHSRISWQQKMAHAWDLECELDGWASNLPARIRPAGLSPSSPSSSEGLAALRQPKWCRLQKIIIEVRYHNVRMLLFRPFLSMLARDSGTHPPGVAEAVDKCITSAKRIIQIVHDAMITNSFFRTWWDNTMHIIFATAVLLLHASRVSQSRGSTIAPQVDVAVDILEAMDECMVARKSSNIIRHMLAQVKGRPTPISLRTVELDNEKNLPPSLDETLTAADNGGSGISLTEDMDFVREFFALRTKYCMKSDS